MQQSTTTNWQSRLTSALSQDPKKTGVLGLLVLILLVVSVRMIAAASHPSTAAGAVTIASSNPMQINVPSPVLKQGSPTASLRGWLGTPIPPVGRNDFLVKSEYFPRDTTKTPSATNPTGFWATLEKSLSLQADQKAKRDTAIANLKMQAGALRPTSIVMGPTPRAMVNGALIAVGDSIGPFRVLKIEPRGIIVERDGVKLIVPMN